VKEKSTRDQEVKDELEKKHGSNAVVVNIDHGTKWFLLVCTQIKKNLLRFSCLEVNTNILTLLRSNSGPDISDVLTSVAVAIENAFSPDSQRDSYQYSFLPVKLWICVLSTFNS